MKHTVTSILLLLFCNTVFAQTQTVLTHVWINPGWPMTLTKTVKGTPVQINKGETLKKTSTYKNTQDGKDETFTVTTEHKVDSPLITIYTDCQATDHLKSFDGKADLFIDETDKSIVHVNYWLSDTLPLKAGTKIQITTRELLCNNTFKTTLETKKLSADTTYRLWCCNPKEISAAPDYYTHSKLSIAVFDNKDTNKVAYYLVDKFNEDADYTIALSNRQALSFKERGIEYGPITVPVKFRPQISKDGKTAAQQWTADLNVGMFGGWRFGRYKARYVRGEGFTKLPSISCTIGGFAGFSALNLDKDNTGIRKDTLKADEKRSIGVLTFGTGAMVTVYNIRFGLFYGYDCGLGNSASYWNYNFRHWFGFGLAYSLTGLWKKD